MADDAQQAAADQTVSTGASEAAAEAAGQAAEKATVAKTEAPAAAVDTLAESVTDLCEAVALLCEADLAHAEADAEEWDETEKKRAAAPQDLQVPKDVTEPEVKAPERRRHLIARAFGM